MASKVYTHNEGKKNYCLAHYNLEEIQVFFLYIISFSIINYLSLTYPFKQAFKTASVFYLILLIKIV